MDILNFSGALDYVCKNIDKWGLTILAMFFVYGITCGSSILSRGVQLAIWVFAIKEFQRTYIQKGFLPAFTFSGMLICVSFAPIIVPFLLKLAFNILKGLFTLTKAIVIFIKDKIEGYISNRRLEKMYSERDDEESELYVIKEFRRDKIV